MNLSTNQKQRNELGGWGQLRQTVTFRTDKQQGPTNTAQRNISNLLGYTIIEKKIK